MEKKKQEEEEEEEGRPVSDGPKSNQRPGSACSQTQTYAAQGRKQRLIHTCSLNNTLGKKIIIKILQHNIFLLLLMNTAFHSLWTAEESKKIFHCFQICWFFCFVFNINKDIIELKCLMFRPHIAFYKHHKYLLELKALLMGSLPFCLSLNQPLFDMTAPE